MGHGGLLPRREGGQSLPVAGGDLRLEAFSVEGPSGSPEQRYNEWQDRRRVRSGAPE